MNENHFARAAFVMAAGLLGPTGASANCLAPAGDLTGNGITNVVDVQCSGLGNLWDLLGRPAADTPACVPADPDERFDVNCDVSISIVDYHLVVSLALGRSLGTLDEDGDGCPDACAGLVAGAPCDPGGAPPAVLWYSGDGDPAWFMGGTHNNIEWPLFDKTEMVFEDFVVPGPLGWCATAVWSHNITNSTQPIVQARWELRAAMTPGPSNAGGGGTLIAGGQSPAQVSVNQSVQIPPFFDSIDETRITVSGVNVYLPPGTYWLGVAPVIVANDQSLPADTLDTAVGAVGAQGLRDNAFVYRRNWLSPGEDTFVPADTFSSMSGPPNYSLGVAGVPVP
jgi:hypothetical protein